MNYWTWRRLMSLWHFRGWGQSTDDDRIDAGYCLDRYDNPWS